jgi:molybdopterin-guanine dinucleotide biosynthesis protein A
MSRYDNVTGVILAGGRSSRMGSNKALLPYRGGRFIEVISRQLAELFREVIVVTNHPDQYAFVPFRKVSDTFPGMGPLAGIHAGLAASSGDAAFVVACDMPYLNPLLIRRLVRNAGSGRVVIPESPHGPEPLHAVYGKECLDEIQVSLAAGETRIRSFFGRSSVLTIPASEVARYDPDFRSFCNINTPQEYFTMRNVERIPPVPVEVCAAG